MSIISDQELIDAANGAEDENVSDLFNYLVGLIERGRMDEVDVYLANHPTSPQIASTIAEVLYEAGSVRENYQLWQDLMALTALSDLGQLSGEACLDLGLNHYDKGQFDDAFKWATRAVDVFKIPEAAFLLGSIFESDPSRRDLVKAAACFIHTSKLIRECEYGFLSFQYFEEDDMPVNLEGQWVDFELLGDYLMELPHDQRDALLDLIKTTKAFK